MTRVLNISGRKDLTDLMRGINVDPYGAKIMLPKARHCLLKVSSLSNIPANILKQEMLSLGGDVAISRDSLTGKARRTDCLIMGSLSQVLRLESKLKRQPFGLKELSGDIGAAVANYQKEGGCIKAGKYTLKLGARPYVMGIVNITPDSFSGDGLINLSKNEIIDYAISLVKEGADIIDIGGESSRPGAKPVSLKEEAKRIIPVIESLARKVDLPISVDTYKPQIANMALDCGASIVNDISGLRNPKMAPVISRHKAAVVIMHMLGRPSSMQHNPKYASLIDEIYSYLKDAVDRAKEAGINKDSIIIDPGIGFGKTADQNLEILKRLREFRSIGKPVLVGTSRKSFIAKALRDCAKNRVFGTAASCVSARINRADIFRVHDVRAMKEALTLTDRINQ